jgi:hypothetical protein
VVVHEITGQLAARPALLSTSARWDLRAYLDAASALPHRSTAKLSLAAMRVVEEKPW